MASVAGRASPVATTRARQAALVLLLAVEVAAVLYVLAERFQELWATRWVQDDAYVSFRYAKNFVLGRGLVYNDGQFVEGYTNFLWTMLSAVPMALGRDDPLPFMHAASAALWLLSYGVLLLLAIRLWSQGIWAAPLAIIALAYHWSFNMWFFSGMETPLVSFLTILALFFFTRDPERHPWTLCFASLSGVLLTMTRPDGVVVLVALGVTGAVLYWRRVVHEGQWRAYVIRPALPILLLWAPFNLWRVYYYGSFFPNTYYTKVAYLTFYSRGWLYLTKYLETFGLVHYLLFVVAGAVVAPLERASRYLIASFMVAAFVAFYLVRLGGDFMEWRFLTPVTATFYVAIVAGASLVTQEAALLPLRWMRGRPPRSSRPETAPRVPDWARAAGWVGGALVALALTQTMRAATPNEGNAIMDGQETIGLLRRYGDPAHYDWRTVGRIFDQVLPPNVYMATTSAGIIPFFCNRRCLDLHGLTDPEIAHAFVDPENRGRMGHEHWLEDYDKIRARGVDVLLHWADPKEYARALVVPPVGGRETVSVQRPDGRYVDFLILNPAAFDHDALAKDPRVVLYGQREVGAKDEFLALRDLYGDLVVVDSIDVENAPSHERHAFTEISPPEMPNHWVYHTKFLRYWPPCKLELEDDGRRIYQAATWQVHNVRADRDLVMIGRYDQTGGARYQIEVNGKTVRGLFSGLSGEEAWNEASLLVPAELLIDGTNEFRMTRVPEGTIDVEWYYLWFAQPADPETAFTCRAPVG